MIREATAKDEPTLLRLAQSQHAVGPLIEIHWRIAKENPQMPHRFFMVNETQAVLKLTALRATLCGATTDAEELASFLTFCGVGQLTTLGLVPTGWQAVEQSLVLLRSPEANRTAAGLPSGFDPAPPAGEVLSILEEGSGRIYPEEVREGFFIDLCVRRNYGLAAVCGIREEGNLVSTAGVYALTETEGYVACVETKRAHRRNGYAQLLLQRLCNDFGNRTLSLFCSEGLEGFYQTFGFAKTNLTGIISEPIKDGTL